MCEIIAGMEVVGDFFVSTLMETVKMYSQKVPGENKVRFIFTKVDKMEGWKLENTFVMVDEKSADDFIAFVNRNVNKVCVGVNTSIMTGEHLVDEDDFHPKKISMDLLDIGGLEDDDIESGEKAKRYVSEDSTVCKLC